MDFDFYLEYFDTFSWPDFHAASDEQTSETEQETIDIVACPTCQKDIRYCNCDCNR